MPRLQPTTFAAYLLLAATFGPASRDVLALGEPSLGTQALAPAATRDHDRSAPLVLDPLLLVVRRWQAATTKKTEDLLSQLGAGAPAGTTVAAAPERIVLRPETSGAPSFHETAHLGPPRVAGVLGELPLVSQAWAVANDLAPGSSERLRDLTLELGGESLLPDELRDFGGGLARGPYSRADDASGSGLTFDFRVVLSWRPRDLVHFEAGYALAYAGGEYGGQLDGQSGRRAEFLRHGPWAAVGIDF